MTHLTCQSSADVKSNFLWIRDFHMDGYITHNQLKNQLGTFVGAGGNGTNDLPVSAC